MVNNEASQSPIYYYENPNVYKQYAKTGVEIARTNVLPVGHNLEIIKGEGTYLELLRHDSWDSRFRELQLPGLEYQECVFINNFWWYANRGDKDAPVVSRNFGVVSQWKVQNGETFGLNADIKSLKIIYPAFDGINYFIGVRRRAEGGNYYTIEEETAMARACVIGGFALNIPEFSTPLPNQELIMCARMPGRIFDTHGNKLVNAASTALEEAGFEPFQNFNPETSNLSRMYIRRSIYTEVDPKRMRYNDGTLELLNAVGKVWDDIVSNAKPVHEPDEDSY